MGTHAAHQACDAGTWIGVVVILAIGFFGFGFLSLIWPMTKPRGCDCPTRGELVRRGARICKGFAYHFVTRTRIGLD